MYKSTITKVLISLVAVIGVSAAGLAAVKVLNRKNNLPVSSTDEPYQTTDKASGVETDSPIGTESSDNPTTHGTEPVNPPQSDQSSNKQEDPPETQPSGQRAPSGFTKSYTLRSDTGTQVNIVATVTATANSDGTVHLKTVVALEHRSLWLGGRTLTVRLGSETFTQQTEKIADENVKQHSTVFGTFETDVLYGQKVDVYVNFPYNGFYDDIEIKTITIETSISIA